MSCDQTYPFPQVFLVDSGGDPQQSAQVPNLVPCWSFPPAQERTRSRGRSRGCMGVSPALATTVLLMFLLVFAALGLGAYEIYKIRAELSGMRKDPDTKIEYRTPEKYTGDRPKLDGETTYIGSAAHVLGRIQDKTHKSLHWEPKSGRAFTIGGINYQTEDGSLQVEEAGLYHIYARVEFIFKPCSERDSLDHSVYLRRAAHQDLILMNDHRPSFCKNQERILTSSYLGCVIQLEKQDRVFVNVSHPINLTHAHNGNFFGLYKI